MESCIIGGLLNSFHNDEGAFFESQKTGAGRLKDLPAPPLSTNGLFFAR